MQTKINVIYIFLISLAVYSTFMIILNNENHVLREKLVNYEKKKIFSGLNHARLSNSEIMKNIKSKYTVIEEEEYKGNEFGLTIKIENSINLKNIYAEFSKYGVIKVFEMKEGEKNEFDNRYTGNILYVVYYD